MKLKYLVAVLLLAACDSPTDIDISGLTALPLVDFANVHPAQPTAYWEMRVAMRTGPVGSPRQAFKMASPGAAVRTGIEPGRLVLFDAALPESSIGSFICGIGDRCDSFVSALRSDVTVYDTMDELRTFLGDIDTGEEATLFLQATGYFWTNDPSETGYRAVPDGWEVVVLQNVKFCAPVESDRVLFHVTRAGVVRELDRGVFRTDKNACV